MAEKPDERSAFDYFWDNANRLQADQNFREVLKELDEGRQETLSLLVSDPAGFLRFRGIQIPQDFRVSMKKTVEPAVAPGGGGAGYEITCDCIVICFLRYCGIICTCRIAA